MIYHYLFGGILLLLGILAAVAWAKKKPAHAGQGNESESLPDPEPLPDEPDERIIVNPIRMNEPEGSILLYRKEGLLVYDGTRIPTDTVKEISFINAANPYLPGEYHILLHLADGQALHVPAGMDGAFVGETVQQLREALAL